MALFNTSDGYGAGTKLLHWLIVALFAFQYVAANIMVRIGPNDTMLAMSQDTYYNWHKSIGLVALALATFRLIARRTGRLPDWAPTLSTRERAFVHRNEQLLYTAMFVMPIAGFLYVMAGGYGVRLFGVVDLANPIGEWPALATGAKWVHIVGSYILLAALAGHIGLVLRHQLVLKDRLLHRMLPSSVPIDNEHWRSTLR